MARIVVARCSVNYAGRLTTHLPEAVRMIIVKADGSVLVHSETSSYKPLNWMVTSTHIEMPTFDGLPVDWVFANKKEQLTICITEVLSDTHHTLSADEPGLSKTGTEFELQAWLADRPHLIEEGASLRGREVQSGAGPVDLILDAADGTLLVVEVKRKAAIDVIGQLTRYVDALEQGEHSGNIRGVIAAWTIGPRVRKLAESKGFICVEVPFEDFLS